MDLNDKIAQTLNTSDLVARYLNGELSSDEQDELLVWINQNDHNRDLFERLCNVQNLDNIYAIFNRFDDITALEKVKANSVFHAERKKTFRLWRRFAAAAAIFLIVGIGAYFYINQVDKSVQAVTYANDVKPGTVGATLTLANGQKIKLSDAVNGELAKEAGMVITKSADGQLVYGIKPALAKAISPKGRERNTTNTLSTAKGETYQVRLPDGSLVALNAASSLTYATSLNERGERMVKLSGEAYFEIFKDKKHPFIVESKGQLVEVLGTHFNINTYPDEASTKTTLLEGSVRVALLSPHGRDGKARESSNIILKPNQQLTLISPSELNGVARERTLKVSQANIEEVISWKNGYFRFNGQDIQTIMKQLSRWYNIDVVYKGKMPKDGFNGKISRNKNISQVLTALEAMKLVHFKLEGRRVTVIMN